MPACAAGSAIGVGDATVAGSAVTLGWLVPRTPADTSDAAAAFDSQTAGAAPKDAVDAAAP